MTDVPEHFSTQTRFEMELLERLQQFQVTNEILHQLGVWVNFQGAAVEFNTDRIHDIAKYLMVDEELDADFCTEDEHDHILNIGMFIYGYSEYYTSEP